MLNLITALTRYIAILVLAFFIAVLLVPLLEPLYVSFFGRGGGFDIDFNDVALFSLVFKFVAPFLFVLLGDRLRYIAAAILVTPVLLFEAIFDPSFIHYSIIPMGAALIIAVVLRLIAPQTLGKMPALEPMKKYF